MTPIERQMALETFQHDYNVNLRTVLDWITSNETGTIPVFVQEILANASTFYLYATILSGFIVSLCFLTIVLCFVKKNWYNEEWFIFPCIIGSVGFMFSSFAFFHNLYQFIIINASPKIWLAENIQYYLL